VIDPGLQGKVVLVTGANHGIGAATAKAFAHVRASLFITYLRLPPLGTPSQRITVGKTINSPLLTHKIAS
jgi:3-oxoacyl-[acyl-carrier protein] reductase